MTTCARRSSSLYLSWKMLASFKSTSSLRSLFTLLLGWLSNCSVLAMYWKCMRISWLLWRNLIRQTLWTWLSKELLKPFSHWFSIQSLTNNYKRKSSSSSSPKQPIIQPLKPSLSVQSTFRKLIFEKITTTKQKNWFSSSQRFSFRSFAIAWTIRILLLRF